MRGGIDKKFFKVFNFGWRKWYLLVCQGLVVNEESYISFMDKIVAKDYKLAKKLGSGAFGEVFLALNVKNHT